MKMRKEGMMNLKQNLQIYDSIISSIKCNIFQYSKNPIHQISKVLIINILQILHSYNGRTITEQFYNWNLT